MLRVPLQFYHGFCVTSAAADTKRKEKLIARLSAIRKQLLQEGVNAGRTFVKKEKKGDKKRSLQSTSENAKRSGFCGLKNHLSVPAREERLGALNKARIEAHRIKLVEKGGVLDRVKYLEKIDSNKNLVCFETEIGKRAAAKTLTFQKRNLLSSSLTYNTQFYAYVQFTNSDVHVESFSSVKLANL